MKVEEFYYGIEVTPKTGFYRGMKDHCYKPPFKSFWKKQYFVIVYFPRINRSLNLKIENLIPYKQK